MLGVSQSRGLKLFGREIIFQEFQPMCSRYLNVTDRQTDGQTDGRLTVASPRSALVSRGKNAEADYVGSCTILYTIFIIICYAQGSRTEHGHNKDSELKTTNTKNVHNKMKCKN